MNEIFHNENKYYSKVIICCCFMAFGTIGIMNCYGMFYTPMSIVLRVPFFSAVIHTAITSLVTGLVSPLALRAIRAVKLRYCTMISCFICLVSGIMIGLGKNLTVIYVGAVLRGVGLAGFSILILNFIIGYWFADRHGIVLNYVLTVSTLASLAMPPVVNLSVEYFGYELTYIIFTVLSVVCCIPVALSVPLKPREIGMKPFVSKIEIQRIEKPSYEKRLENSERLFIMLLVFSLLVVSIPTVFLQTFGRTKGLSSMQGAYLISFSMMGNFLFKTMYWRYKYSVGVKKMIMLNLVLTVAGLICMDFQMENYILSAVGCFLYGAANVNASVGISELVYQVYGQDFLEAYTSISIQTGVSSAVATALMGYSYYLLQGFSIQLIILIIHTLAAMALILMIQKELNGS